MFKHANNTPGRRLAVVVKYTKKDSLLFQKEIKKKNKINKKKKKKKKKKKIDMRFRSNGVIFTL